MLSYLASIEFWQTLMTSLGGSALVALIARTWIVSKIKMQVEDTYKAKQQKRQAEFDEALELKKHELTGELEGWKAGYTKAIDENRIRFSRLHEDRVTAISKLYARLAAVEEGIGRMVASFKWVSEDEPALRENAYNAFTRFQKYYSRHRIYFTGKDCSLIDDLSVVAKRAYGDYTFFDDVGLALDPQSQGKKRESQMEAAESMRTKFPAIKRRLEEQFRKAMGMVGSEEEVWS